MNLFLEFPLFQYKLCIIIDLKPGEVFFSNDAHFYNAHHCMSELRSVLKVHFLCTVYDSY